jgi:hypothetical protein
MNIDGNVVVGLLGVLVAVAIPVIVHRATHPKREISYHTTAEPVWHGTTNPRPAANVVLQVWCSGRADVPSSRFDAGIPLTFRFDDPVLAVTKPESSPEPWRFRQEGPHDVTLGPVVLGRGTLFSATVTVDAVLPVDRRVGVRVWNPLVDTEVVPAPAPPNEVTGKPRARRSIGTVGIGVILTITGFVLFVLYVILITAVYGGGEPNSELVVLLALLAVLGTGMFLGGLVTLLIAGIARIARAIASRRAKRDSGGVREAGL